MLALLLCWPLGLASLLTADRARRYQLAGLSGEAAQSVRRARRFALLGICWGTAAIAVAVVASLTT